MARSNARAGPSQSQRPSQTQGTRAGRGQVEEVPEEEEEEEEEEDDDDDERGAGAAMDVDDDDDDGSELARRTNDLVRLALFTEHKRTVLRREEINKKVLGPNTRAFNYVFAHAQRKLRNTFGMELAELPSRAGLEQENNDEGENAARTATGVKKKSGATGSKTYILRSTLDPILIEHAAQTEPDILEEEAGDQSVLFPSLFNFDDEGDEDDEDDDAERIPKYYGSLISWTKGDHLGVIGVLYVILALVLVNGRVMTDIDLRRHLRTLHLPSNPNTRPIRYSASSTTRSQNIDGYLSQLLKQGYLDRQQIGGDAGGKKGKKSGAGSKRLRTQAEDLEEGRTFEWRWGTRAFSEVGEKYIGKFIAEFMVSTGVNHEEEGQAAGAAARTKEEDLVKKMYVGVEKAAGGKLMELK